MIDLNPAEALIIRFSLPWSHSTTLLRYLVCRFSSSCGHFPSRFSNASTRPYDTVLAVPADCPQDDVTLQMTTFQWIPRRLSQQNVTISLPPSVLCNSANWRTTLPSGIRIWSPEFTDKTLFRKIAAVHDVPEFLFIKLYPFTQMSRIEFRWLSHLSNVALLFDDLPDSRSFELGRECVYGSPCFEHPSPQIDCFNINRF